MAVRDSALARTTHERACSAASSLVRHAVRAIPGFRIAASLTLGVLTIEVCARIDDYIEHGAPLLQSYNLDRIYTYDSIGKRGRPHGQYRQWTLNSLGFRGPELRAGRIRILCLGASETFGLYEPPEDVYPRRLEAELNTRAKWDGGRERFEVVNAAYAGQTLATVHRRLTETLAHVNPKIAVYYPTPANYLEQPAHTPAVTEENAPPSGLELRFLQRARPVVKRIEPGLFIWYYRYAASRGLAADVTVMDRVPEARIDQLRSDLRAFVGELRSASVEPVLVTHATRFGDPLSASDRYFLTAWRKFYPQIEETGFLDLERRANVAIRETGLALNATVIDAAQMMSGHPGYFADFAHFTSAGGRRMGEILAEGIAPVLEQTSGR